MDQARQQQGAQLDVLEAAVRAQVHAALPALLGAVVALATPDLDPASATVHRRCPGCGVLVRMHRQRPRTVQTTCGSLGLTRPWYHCPSCRHGFSPADTTLALTAPAHISAALEAWLVRRNVSTTPREAAALLTELTGVVVGMDTIREPTTAVGAAVAEADTRAIPQVQQTGASATPVAPVPGHLVVETDGAMVHVEDEDGWQEVTSGVVGGVVDGTVTAARYVAARESAEVFGPRLLAETARRGALAVVRWEGPLTRPGLAVLPPVHVVGDGAHWLWTLAAAHFGQRTEAVAFYHAAEHVWTVARAVFGEGAAAAAAGAPARTEELKHQGGRPVHAALFALTAPTAAATEVLRMERGYFTTNLSRMAYPALQAQGWPIGSGAGESRAQHVVQQRMKRPGPRWRCRGGRAMRALRTRFASGRSLHAPVLSSILQHDPAGPKWRATYGE